MSTHESMRSKALRVAAGVLGIPTVLAGGFALASHLIWHRSTMGTANELALRSRRTRRKLQDGISFDNLILDRSVANEDRYTLPTLFTPHVAIIDEEVAGMQTFSLNRRGINDRAVIYLHGGAYIKRPKLETWRFLDSLASKTRAEVIVPMYPLAPVHTFEEAYAALDELYTAVSAKYGDTVTLMGSGAGGGLAAGFCEWLAAEGRSLPKNLVLLSPWLDLTFKNPDIRHLEATDPVLAVSGLEKAARLWSGGTDLTDYRLSPALGDVRSLRRLLIITGTREILYPDAKLFYDRAHAAGVRAKLYVGSGLNHLFVLNRLPEATRALAQVVRIVTED